MTNAAERRVFGQRLRALRENEGWGQADVAAELKSTFNRSVTPQAISGWEKGKFAPDAETTRQLEHLLRCEAGQLGILLGYAPGPTVDDRLTALEDQIAEMVRHQYEVEQLSRETLELVRKLAGDTPRRRGKSPQGQQTS